MLWTCVLLLGGLTAWLLGWLSGAGVGGDGGSPRLLLRGEPDPLANDDADARHWLEQGAFAADPNVRPLDDEPLGISPPEHAEHVFRFRRALQGLNDDVSLWRIMDQDMQQAITHYQQQARQRRWQPTDTGIQPRDAGTTTLLHFQPEQPTQDGRTLTIGLQPRGSTILATICLRTPSADPGPSSVAHP